MNKKVEIIRRLIEKICFLPTKTSEFAKALTHIIGFFSDILYG